MSQGSRARGISGVRRAAGRRGSTRGGAAGWVGEGSTHPAPSHHPDWYCQGPTHCQDPVSARPPGTPGPSRPLRTPGSPRTQIALLDPIRARFHQIYTKVSHKLGVSPVFIMRPGIVPVSKPGLKVTTLNFQDSGIGQPSLPRNKWSHFRLAPVNMVKTAKCRQNVHVGS